MGCGSGWVAPTCAKSPLHLLRAGVCRKGLKRGWVGDQQCRAECVMRVGYVLCARGIVHGPLAQCTHKAAPHHYHNNTPTRTQKGQKKNQNKGPPHLRRWGTGWAGSWGGGWRQSPPGPPRARGRQSAPTWPSQSRRQRSAASASCPAEVGVGVGWSECGGGLRSGKGAQRQLHSHETKAGTQPKLMQGHPPPVSRRGQ